MKEQYKMLETLLNETRTVRVAVSVQGEHMGTQMIWDNLVRDDGGNAELCQKWRAALQDEKGGTCVKVGRDRVFVQDYSAMPDLVILGGGHISKALVPLGKMLGYRVTLADDRPEFAEAGRKAGADRTVCKDYSEVFGDLPQGPNVSYVVVTRGHQGDEICVRQILQKPFLYAGMIGSGKKVAAVREKLEEEGIAHERTEQLHAPIGLDIGAVTPEEIAVSIAAELILVRNQKMAAVMGKEMFESLNGAGGKILVTVVEKHGSAPRGAGACMTVDESGRQTGTIGGGAIEYEACRHAVSMLREGKTCSFRTYELSREAGAALGMVCGGSNGVFFQKVESGGRLPEVEKIL